MITLEDLIEECASETDIVEKLRKLDTNSRDRLIMIINDNNVVGTAKFLSILPNRKLEITKLLMSWNYLQRNISDIRKVIELVQEALVSDEVKEMWIEKHTVNIRNRKE